MARTVRTRITYTGTVHEDFAPRLEHTTDKTCKPGCEVCGKGEIRRERRRNRRNERNIIAEQYDY